MLVYFRGSGEWFVKDNDTFKRAFSCIKKGSTPLGTYRDIIEVYGTFRLADEDEEIYRYEEKLDHVKFLLPCHDPNSHFQKMVKEGKLSDKEFDFCKFEIIKKSRTSRSREKIEIPCIIKTVEIDIDQSRQPIDNGLPDYLNPQHPRHSNELLIAIELLGELSEKYPEKPKRRTFKSLAIDWLNEKHPELSRWARERIATMVNPEEDKKGGCPPSN